MTIVDQIIMVTSRLIKSLVSLVLLREIAIIGSFKIKFVECTLIAKSSYQFTWKDESSEKGLHLERKLFRSYLY